jgi:glycine cleavage system aminomethyltransferase T
VWSPGLGRNIGFVWVPIDMADPGTKLEIHTEHGTTIEGTTASIPFVDPRKEAPAAALA